jgi:hypothetical protein
MAAWPAIAEPLLRERQAMSDDEFFAFLAGLLAAIGSRELPDTHFDLAVGYPWERPSGSCLVRGDEVQELDADPRTWADMAHEYLSDASRVPLLAYGANASPGRLAAKLAHLPAEHREALVLAAELEGFDVGAAAQPPVFSSMPATLVPSPATAVRAAVLLLTPVQFTTLWWTELSYRVGALEGVRVRIPGAAPLTRVLAFVSRFGAFTVDGSLVCMAAIPAERRRWPALTQAALLDAAARVTLGEAATARDLVRAAYEEPARFLAEHHATLRAAAVPFASGHWHPMPAGA